VNLVIPFFSWAIINYIYFSLKNGEFDYWFWLNLFFHPDANGLWFLWVLFLCHLSLWITCEVKKRYSRFNYFYTLILIQLIPFSVAGIGFLRWYFIFYSIGLFFHSSIQANIKQYKAIQIVSTFLIFSILVIFFRFNAPPSFFNLSSNTLITKIFTKGYDLITALAGIAFCLTLISYMKSILAKSRLILYFGKNTLEIYTSHQLFIFIILYFISIKEWGLIQILSLMVVSLFLSLVLAILLKRSKLLAFIFYGKTYFNESI
jgi:fucose 4-O-acetylase-like acetyltransferase